MEQRHRHPAAEAGPDTGGHGHSHGHETRGIPAGRLLGVILLNLVITVVEYVAGVLSGSLALISDAGHNLSDVLAMILGYAGEKIATTAPDPRRSFGLKRFEILVATANALTLVVIGIYVLAEAIERFSAPVDVDTGLLIPVALVGLAANFVSVVILHRDRDHDLNLRATFLHLLYDTLSSAAVVGVGVVLLFLPSWTWLDLVVSLLIVVMILWSSVGVLRTAMRVLLQIAPPTVDPEAVHAAILALEPICDVHGLHIWSVDSREVFLSSHVRVRDPGVDVNAVIRQVNALLEDRFGIRHTTLQVETDRLCTPEDHGTCCGGGRP